MKKFLPAALLALSLSAISHREASAWCKFTFGVGANVGYQSGGNKSFLWGLWSSSDSGNATTVSSMPMYGGMQGYGGMPSVAGPTPPVPSGAYPHPEMGGNTETGPMPGPAKESANPKTAPYQATAARPVSFFTATTSNGYYQVPSAVQAPSYWYGK